MISRIHFFINRLGERLWIRPFAMCLFSIAAVYMASFADSLDLAEITPDITIDTIQTLLSIIASSMLVIATFAVGSMVSSYASASNTATPRSFALLVSDHVSQNALSSYIGAFIFSIVALVALMNKLFGITGRFTLFCLTIVVFAAVIITFVRWVDSIARLGRLGTVIKRVETATATSMRHRRQTMTLGGASATPPPAGSIPIYGESVGYLQRIEPNNLQEYAEKLDMRICVIALPGTFCAPGVPLAFVVADAPDSLELDHSCIASAFRIGDTRTFEEDPRYGLVVLAQIASRALSPAVNDSGTAIDIIGTFVRLFDLWSKPLDSDAEPEIRFDRVEIPELTVHNMFDDAFTSIARDGAPAVEVGIALQKALLALARAELALTLHDDLDIIRRLSDGTVAHKNM